MSETKSGHLLTLSIFAAIVLAVAVAAHSTLSGVAPLIRVIIGLFAWGLLVFMHYKFWRQFLATFQQYPPSQRSDSWSIKRVKEDMMKDL